jgi:hypothetical protein
MNKHEKLLLKILRGISDADMPFDSLCGLLFYLTSVRYNNSR